MAPPKLRDTSHWCSFLYRAPIDYSASVLWFTSGIIPLLSRSILLLSISLSTYTYTLNNEELNWWDFFVIAVSVGERTSRDREYCTRFKSTKFRPPLFKKVKTKPRIKNPWWSKRLDSAVSWSTYRNTIVTHVTVTQLSVFTHRGLVINEVYIYLKLARKSYNRID